MSSDRTLVVVGGGPAGVTAALQACELGAQVTLLEAGQIGGTSLNRGPAPVRTLARTARLVRDWSSWTTFGLDGSPPVPNLPVVVANSDRWPVTPMTRRTWPAVCMAAQKISRTLGIGSFPQVWSYLGPED